MKKHIFLFFLSLYLLTMGGHFYSNDHYAMYMVTANIFEKHSLEIAESPFSIETSEEKSYSWYELGQSIIALPFYAAGKFADKLFKTDFLKQFFVASQNTFFAAGACLLLFMIALKLNFGASLSLLITFVYGIGTMAWVYSANFFAGTPASFFLLLNLLSSFAMGRAVLSDMSSSLFAEFRFSVFDAHSDAPHGFLAYRLYRIQEP